MEPSPPYLLHSANVCITAEHHDPMILNPSLLADREIVPADWKAVNSRTALMESTVQYEKVTLEMNPSRLVITEGFERPFGDNYQIYDVADACLDKIPYAPYRSLGLNYRVYMDQDSPEQWMCKRFLPPSIWDAPPRMLSIQPNFTIDTSDRPLCKISLHAGTRTPPQGEPVPIVLVDVNLDHPETLSADDMREAISQWRERQRFVISVLNKLLKEIQV